jgi:hypothetical protein
MNLFFSIFRKLFIFLNFFLNSFFISNSPPRFIFHLNSIFYKMLNFNDLAVHFLNSSSRGLMSGGAAKVMNSGTGWFSLFLVTLFFFFVKAWLIYVTYNMVVPKIMASMNVQGWDRFREISYWDALLMMILFNNLMN